jgi:hypothetical protein
MPTHEELRLLIPAYTPDTMPLGRLIEYLKEIAEVVGDVSDEMHLVKILKSSTRPVFKMTPLAADRARQQIAVVRSGSGTSKQRDAYGRVRQMVRADGGRPVKLADRTGVLLNFDPAVDEAQIIATARQATTFDGTLIRVGGSSETSTVLMQDLSGETLAKAMASYLFDPLRVFGTGSWERYRSGKWRLGGMTIQHFEPLPTESLLDTLQKMRDAAVDWPEEADVAMRAERELAL